MPEHNPPQNRIFLVDGFISPIECCELIALGQQSQKGRTGIQNDLVPEWKRVSDFAVAPGSELDVRIKDIHERIGKQIADLYEVEATPREDGYFYEYNIGDFYHPHVDSQTVANVDGATVAMRKASSADVSSVLYLNDNFVGGELEFCFTGRKVQPKAGRLLLFYGGWQNAHRVLPIELGKRYCIVNWFISEPYLVPLMEQVSSPYAEQFNAWQEAYREVKTMGS